MADPCRCQDVERLGSTNKSVTDTPWDGAAGRFSDEQYQRACAACDPEEKGTVKQRCFLPHHEPDGTINRNGVHAAAQRVGHLSGRSPSAVSKAKAHLRAHYDALDEDPPDSLRSAAGLDRRARAGLLKGRECRRFRVAPLELRDGAGTLILAGYASVTERPYDMGFYTETIAAGAFKKTLSEDPDVQLLINHEGLPLARTTTGSLRLTEDGKGLHIEADLDPDDPDVARLAPKMARGDVDEMSFAFRAVRQEWDDDYTERRLSEVSIDRGDVSVVSYGANPATSVSLRAYADSLLELRAGKTLSTDTMATLQQVLDLVAGADDNVDEAQEVLSTLMGVPNPDKPEPDAGDQQQNSQSLDWLRARAAQARYRAVA
jgi:uncharacterized protein